ncbi:MAG: tetratricopeptide repeat protein [Xanthomonadales bacterium]|nr:tetratricopeptide repeat protein [Xanthomonadales bacterium]
MAFEVLDEHEQGELVRKWLRANAMSIAVGIAIGLALIFGWQQWKARQVRNQGEAALQYRAFMDAVAAKRDDDAAKIAESLRSGHSASAYAVFAALAQAEAAVRKGDLAAAQADLAFADRNAADPVLKSLIALRTARVTLAAGDAAAALARLDGVPKADFNALASELRGDALAKLGRPADARAAYEEALKSLDPMAPGRDIVQMKLGDLPTAETSKS